MYSVGDRVQVNGSCEDLDASYIGRQGEVKSTEIRGVYLVLLDGDEDPEEFDEDEIDRV